MEALCVIDMQRHFMASFIVLKPVIALCKKCLREGIPVFNVVYGDSFYGDRPGYNTYPALDNLLKDCPRVVKYQNDGSSALEKPLKKRGITHVFLCGVNLDCCVVDTAMGLIQEGFTAEIIKEASATDTPWTRDTNRKMRGSNVPVKNFKETILASAA
jgi:nicotinamidase-related amidase